MNKIKELQEQAQELIDLGNSKEKMEGRGMNRVLSVFDIDTEDVEHLIIIHDLLLQLSWHMDAETDLANSLNKIIKLLK